MNNGMVMSQKNSSSTKEFDLSSNFSSPLEDSSAPTWPYKWWVKNQQRSLFKAILKYRSRRTELIRTQNSVTRNAYC